MDNSKLNLPNPSPKPSKNPFASKKIKVDFERTSWWTRFKIKFISSNFLVLMIFKLFRFALLLGGAFYILMPFITWIAGSFMTHADIVDITVNLIPRYPTLETYVAIITENGFLPVLLNTFLLSLVSALLQTAVCCVVGYGLAKFKFTGNKLVWAAVILTLIIPHPLLRFSMQMHFTFFDVGIISRIFNGSGLLSLFGNARGVNMVTSAIPWPLVLLSVTGLGFKNGLFIFFFRQYFKGIPDELEESAYIDGSGVFRTFLKVILPLAVPMLITVFMLSFAWQWTDEFYTTIFTGSGQRFLPDIMVRIPPSLAFEGRSSIYDAAIRNTTGLLIIIPLVIIYLFFQRHIIQGIERSGITG